MNKRTETRRRWEQIVARYARSGLSQSAFAAAHRVGEPALRYWIYKFRNEARGPTPSPTDVRLLPVEVAGLSTPSIELRLGAVSIVLPPGTQATYVAEIATALRASGC